MQRSIRAQPIVDNTFFECVGHSLQLGLTHTLSLLIASFDPGATYLPNPETWVDAFEDLKKRKIEDYYYGSPVRLAPIGAYHLFEAQARFSQMQYLHLASGAKSNWTEFRAMGMLESPYIDAFDRFLEWSDTPTPSSVTSPEVLLFLLVCDLAINPGDGYPFEIAHYESFVASVDPGKRFFLLCRYIAKKPRLKTAIVKCSAQEYEEISMELCHSHAFQTPREIAEKIIFWANTQVPLQKLLKEDDVFKFDSVNLPVRVLFARHIRLMQAKAKFADFFCWPGMYFAEGPGRHVNLGETEKLWGEFQPIFGGEIGGDMESTLLPGRDVDGTQRTCNEFFLCNVLYDAVRQWTAIDGSFDFGYSWLGPKYSESAVRGLANRALKETFGVSVDEFAIVQ